MRARYLNKFLAASSSPCVTYGPALQKSSALNVLNPFENLDTWSPALSEAGTMVSVVFFKIWSQRLNPVYIDVYVDCALLLSSQVITVLYTKEQWLNHARCQGSWFDPAKHVSMHVTVSVVTLKSVGLYINLKLSMGLSAFCGQG